MVTGLKIIVLDRWRTQMKMKFTNACQYVNITACWAFVIHGCRLCQKLSLYSIISQKYLEHVIETTNQLHEIIRK